MSRRKGWTCQRQTDGQKCKYHNAPRARKCIKCGKLRPKRVKAAHMVALELDYAEFIHINGGERCGICGRGPSARRRLDRDHDHKSHAPRGLLCPRCNRALPSWMTIEWLKAAMAYLQRAADRINI